MIWRADLFGFYRDRYHGTALSREEFRECAARAADVLEEFERTYRVAGSEDSRAMAICAMAEVIAYFSAAQDGQGGLRYAKVGSVSVSGKGIYSQVDISPVAERRELYRAAARYLTICRAV